MSKHGSALAAAAYLKKSPAVWSEFETDVYVREYHDHVALAVRGTEFAESVFSGHFLKAGWSNALDVLKDLRFFPWKIGIGWVHRGFYRGAKRWYNRYGLKIAEMNKPVCIYGHSLGAAVAVQLAVIMKDAGFFVHHVHVYGEPPGFYGKSAENYRAKGIRTVSYVFGDDWIQRAKFPGLKAKTSVPATKVGWDSGNSRSDHNIYNYVKAFQPRYSK